MSKDDPAGRPSAGETLIGGFRQAARRRPAVRDVRPLFRLAPLIRQHWRRAALSVIFLVLAAGAQMGLTIAARRLVDSGLKVADLGALTRGFLMVGGVVAAFGVFSGLRLYFAQSLGERVAIDLRRQVFDHALTLDVAHFLKMRIGEVLSRLTADMMIIEMVMGSAAHLALRSLVLLASALVLLAFVDRSFTVLVLVLLVTVLGPLLLYGRRVRGLSRAAQDRLAEAMVFAGESLDALETVQAFGREEHAAARFRQATEAARKAGLSRIRARAVLNGLLIVAVLGGMLGILFHAATGLYLRHDLTGGTLVQLLMLALMAGAAIREIGDVWGELQRASGALDRIGELLDAHPAIAPPANPVPFPVPSRGEIRFDRVVFSYPGRQGQPALEGFSLHVRPGERVALVGPSGAGKSTVLRLLLRFYDPQSGVVSVDGIDVRTADPRDVRARIALVAQDASLFSGSAAENIAFGNAEATPQSIHSAASAAQAASFLSRLPEGLDTPVGERGGSLSGGQRQRVAIARALIRDAPILLLDEATSALDAENEQLVQQALHRAMRGHTTLVIAHRLATVLEADRIVVMDNGRVVEEGRHAELMARGGFYARVARLQFGEDAA